MHKNIVQKPLPEKCSWSPIFILYIRRLATFLRAVVLYHALYTIPNLYFQVRARKFLCQVDLFLTYHAWHVKLQYDTRPAPTPLWCRCQAWPGTSPIMMPVPCSCCWLKSYWHIKGVKVCCSAGVRKAAGQPSLAEKAKCGQASAEQPTTEFREGNVHCQRQDAWRLWRRSGRSLVGTTRAQPQASVLSRIRSSPFIRVFERSVLLCVEWRADQPQPDCIPSTWSGSTPASPCHTTWSFASPRAHPQQFSFRQWHFLLWAYLYGSSSICGFNNKLQAVSGFDRDMYTRIR